MGLELQQVALVTHDIGNMVGYALAAQYPERVTRWVVMDAPLPGIGHWDDQLKNPKVWHFNFRGPDVERLVAGRERILLDRFYNDFPPIRRASTSRRATTMPRSMRGQAPFTTPSAASSPRSRKTPSTTKHCSQKWQADDAGAGDRRRSFLWRHLATEIGFAAANVTRAVINNSGHWIMEEQPEQAVTIILSFLKDE